MVSVSVVRFCEQIRVIVRGERERGGSAGSAPSGRGVGLRESEFTWGDGVLGGVSVGRENC